MSEPIRIFFSYAREDQRPLLHLATRYLARLSDRGQIEMWYDRQLVAGDEWAREIDERIARADIIVALLSPEFVDSEPCRREMTLAKRRRVKVIPVVVHPVTLRGPLKWLNKRQHLPSDGIPVSRWFQREEEAWGDVADGIERAIARVREERNARTSVAIGARGRVAAAWQQLLSWLAAQRARRLGMTLASLLGLTVLALMLIALIRLRSVTVRAPATPLASPETPLALADSSAPRAPPPQATLSERIESATPIPPRAAAVEAPELAPPPGRPSRLAQPEASPSRPQASPSRSDALLERSGTSRAGASPGAAISSNEPPRRIQLEVESRKQCTALAGKSLMLGGQNRGVVADDCRIDGAPALAALLLEGKASSARIGTCCTVSGSAVRPNGIWALQLKRQETNDCLPCRQRDKACSCKNLCDIEYGGCL